MTEEPLPWVHCATWSVDPLLVMLIVLVAAMVILFGALLLSARLLLSDPSEPTPLPGTRGQEASVTPRRRPVSRR